VPPPPPNPSPPPPPSPSPPSPGSPGAQATYSVALTFSATTSDIDEAAYTAELARVVGGDAADFVLTSTLADDGSTYSVEAVYTASDVAAATDAAAALQAVDLTSLASAVGASTVAYAVQPTVQSGYVDSPSPPPLPLADGQYYLGTITYTLAVSASSRRRRLSHVLYTTAEVEERVFQIFEAGVDCDSEALEPFVPGSAFGAGSIQAVETVATAPQSFDLTMKVNGDYGPAVKELVASHAFAATLSCEAGEDIEVSAVRLVMTTPPALPPPSPPAATVDPDAEGGQSTDITTEDGDLSSGGVALVVIMCLLCFIIVILIPCFLYKQRQQEARAEELKQIEVEDDDTTTTTSATPV